MNKYRTIKNGDIIKETDEVLLWGWEKVTIMNDKFSVIGKTFDNKKFGYEYRRLIKRNHLNTDLFK